MKTKINCVLIFLLILLICVPFTVGYTIPVDEKNHKDICAASQEFRSFRGIIHITGTYTAIKGGKFIPILFSHFIGDCNKQSVQLSGTLIEMNPFSGKTYYTPFSYSDFEHFDIYGLFVGTWRFGQISGVTNSVDVY